MCASGRTLTVDVLWVGDLEVELSYRFGGGLGPFQFEDEDEEADVVEHQEIDEVLVTVDVQSVLPRVSEPWLTSRCGALSPAST